ncbi:RimK family protein [Planctomicrobium piriforme]|uniref:Glutathione synthase/RimK-type ligase, ATP-grasp superfamily n=1 Tax=Planctomicrobium piriforme TaxID=1576369 RepID=A0A1I3SSF7_9PLAN|nr:RimK family protein [Planctomicrobium piriforme]SFJ61744.1 Glutathione synthase/RimK-type ligase, ATP-grasp superfamily [Planctomicrobium piriforme]
MPALIVTDSVNDWPEEIPNVEIVDAWRYVTDEEFAGRRNVKLYNLCQSLKYQSTGYYVSLLAEARGHRPMPGVIALQDLKTPAMIRFVGDELDELIQKSLGPLQSEEFELSIYFGRNMAKRYERLSKQLFNMFQIPLLRFRFTLNGTWQIRSVKALGTNEVPEMHRMFMIDAAEKHFSGGATPRPRLKRTRFDLAILHDPEETEASPSNEGALKKFIKAGESVGLNCELITRDDYGRLMEYDALFIRQTTGINHYTYRFARRAANEGLVVIDDPVSIARCTNKVYLQELLERHKIPMPVSLVVHRDNADEIATKLGFPCVLKKPDSSFSQGVVKVHNEEDLHVRLKEFFAQSELLVAQQFLPTTFDWRIGILDQRPLFACQYFMAPGHWQIIHWSKQGDDRYGNFKTLPVELAPRKAVQIALKSANLIGDGLYGVDVKESDGNFYIIEVNDNPNMDSGCEDEVLRDELYRRVMESFLRRIEQQKSGLTYR